MRVVRTGKPPLTKGESSLAMLANAAAPVSNGAGGAVGARIASKLKSAGQAAIAAVRLKAAVGGASGGATAVSSNNAAPHGAVSARRPSLTAVSTSPSDGPHDGRDSVQHALAALGLTMVRLASGT